MNAVHGGKGYHVDATWGQKGSSDNVILQYFMQTDEERKADGMDTDKKVIFYMPEDTVLEFKYED